MRHQKVSIGKIHVSIQQMLAEARKIVKPPHKMQSMLDSSNSHLQIHLPSTHMNDHLREILHLPLQSYKKIERYRGKSLTKLQERQKNEEASSNKMNQPSNYVPPMLLTRLTDRYQLKGIINNFESELVDQKFHQNIQRHRRPLYHKKTISLQPESTGLPTLIDQRRLSHQSKEGFLDNSTNRNPKIYLTITQEELIRARQKLRDKQYNTIEQKYPSMLRQLIELSNSRVKHQKIQKAEQKVINPQSPKHNGRKLKTKDGLKKITHEQRYEPWIFEAQEPEIPFDFNRI